MPFFEDRVRLMLDGHEVPIIEQYEVNAGILTVPAAFSMAVGHGGIFATLAAQFPPITPFELYVGDVKVQQGETDSIGGDGGDATTMRIAGRDDLKRLAKGHLTEVKSLTGKTYYELARTMLDQVGFSDRKLVTSNASNRKAVSASLEDDATAQETDDRVLAREVSTTSTHKTLKTQVGEDRLSFLTKVNKRAGLFIWSDSNGNFVLSRPNTNQRPKLRLVRRRGAGAEINPVNVVGKPDFRHDTTNRYSECVVLGSGGVGKDGRTRFEGRAIDQEMVRLLNRTSADQAANDGGGKRQEIHVIKDPKVKSKAEADYLAKRRIAEWRREAWQLRYKVHGHTAPALFGGGRLVWAQDTMVEVIDDELGIEGEMWVESVRFGSTPERWTEIHVMRTEDLVFAEELDEKLLAKPGVAKSKADGIQVSFKPQMWTSDPNVWAWNSGIIRVNGATTDPIRFTEAVGMPISSAIPRPYRPAK